MDISDTTWEQYLEPEDLKQMLDEKIQDFDEPLPAHLIDILKKLGKKTCSRSIHEAFDSISCDPINNADVFWLKYAVMDFVLIFMDQNDIPITVPSTEKDLLDDYYSFIKKSKRLSKTSCTTDKESRSSSDYLNANRTIGSMKQEDRKIAGEKPDLCFIYSSNELACVEIGLHDVGSHGTKELNESSIKAPIMMKNFALQISRKYNMEMKDIMIVGYVISGFSMTTIAMNFKGSSAFITKSKRVQLPINVMDIPRLLPEVLRLVYNSSMIIKRTITSIKEISTSVSFSNANDIPFFPGCFSPTKKKKTTESDVETLKIQVQEIEVATGEFANLRLV